jgi:orotate phosphoribosyltransferase-like protein
MNEGSSEMKHKNIKRTQIEWRRSKVQELLVKGNNHYEIASVLQVSRPTITRDVEYLRQQAKENMKNHIADLPFNIKQATNGLNKLISMLYDIQDLDIMKAQGRQASDHVRVMAIGLIKDCIKEKIEILTSQGAVNHALDFVEKTNQQIKEQFNEDMQQVIEQEKVQSAAISDAVKNYPEIESYVATECAGASMSAANVDRSEELEEEDNTEEDAEEHQLKEQQSS